MVYSNIEAVTRFSSFFLIAMNVFADVVRVFNTVKIFNVTEKCRDVDLFVIVFSQMLMAGRLARSCHT